MDPDVVDIIGDPGVLEKELEAFRESARVLSSKQRHLIARYPKRWVAIYEGDVAADAATLHELMAEIEDRGLPRGHMIVRYIDKNPRKMIL
ncbi:MAG: hypothetical protein WEB52_07230 [Dehalococcoidia bacterium]